MITHNLPIDAKIALASEMVDDFCILSKSKTSIPPEKTYKIRSSEEDSSIGLSARTAALKTFQSPLVKLAFDTRRVDQETERNPRTNLQYWHRTDPFIDESDQKKLEIFAKLYKIVNGLKSKLGSQQEWHESYVRQLYDNLNRILRIKQADLDIFRPQLSYLEQIIFARYRLSMENLEKYADVELEKALLKKDEALTGKHEYLKATEDKVDVVKDSGVSKNGLEKTTQESIVNAIFGAANLRTNGEKTVERTITIKIVDNVVEE